MARQLGFSCDCGGPDQSRADCDVCTPSFKPGASMTFITVANSGLPSGDKARYSPSRQPRVTRKLAHPASAGDITQGRTNQTAIARIFVNARKKKCRAMSSSVVRSTARSHLKNCSDFCFLAMTQAFQCFAIAMARSMSASCVRFTPPARNTIPNGPSCTKYPAASKPCVFKSVSAT